MSDPWDALSKSVRAHMAEFFGAEEAYNDGHAAGRALAKHESRSLGHATFGAMCSDYADANLSMSRIGEWVVADGCDRAAEVDSSLGGSVMTAREGGALVACAYGSNDGEAARWLAHRLGLTGRPVARLPCVAQVDMVLPGAMVKLLQLPEYRLIIFRELPQWYARLECSTRSWVAHATTISVALDQLAAKL